VNPSSRTIRLLLELRRGGITDTRVLAAMERVPREEFVPEPFQDKAYDNVALPIGHHQTVSQPLVVARMIQALQVGERMKVLEVGTGSGYQAAILSRLCRRLYTIERYRDLLERAERSFAALRLSNITAMVGDGAQGWPRQAPFDRIAVAAAARTFPPALIDQLAVGGLIVAPLGPGDGPQRLVRARRTEDGVAEEILDEVRFVPLMSGVAES
jgi:protein-L-isoaspartate(D-aspartate) O-methyltransferase